MPIFKIRNNKVHKLKSNSFKNEKALQNLIEKNLEEIFGVLFIDTEVSTGEKHGGRIDSLGLDEDNCPVIFEYKCGENENVINQGLYYLDWLVDHKGDYELLVEKSLGKKMKVQWDSPRLILVANSFNKYDKYAVNQMAENIELWTYNLYGDDLLEIKMEGSSQIGEKKRKRRTKVDYTEYDLQYHLKKTSKDMQKVFLRLREKILELNNVIEKAEQKSGITYRTSRSFTHVNFRKSLFYVLVRKSKYKDPKKIVRDISGFMWGYNGQIKLKDENDINRVFDIIKQSYKETL
ncbi:MAG: hypothetical protein IIA45_11705 [Bacteroidetes bacterium]|nr:hypothetical protein [Bacteroidota bacterium]